MTALQWLPNSEQFGSLFVTASLDGTAKVWSAQKGEAIATFEGHRDQILTLDAKLDSDQVVTVVTASDDHTAKVWRCKVEPVVA